jgi:lipoprotein-anchoring transpeptidase ErfK/SrfK
MPIAPAEGMTSNFCSAVAIAVVAFSVPNFTTAQQVQTQPSQALPAAQTPTNTSATSPANRLLSLDEKTQRGLALQVALDRAGFSPGEIDGAPGANTDRALAAFRAAHGTEDLGESSDNALTTYTISEQDAAGPFAADIPQDMVEKSKLSSLSYSSLLELLGERFHASPKLLQRLNPKATFAAGETITVPNVEPFVPPAPKTETPANTGKPADAVKAGNSTAKAGNSTAADPDRPVTVIVTDRTKTLQVHDPDGNVLFHAPVTVGSENDPLPVGEWKINGVGRNPVFNYNPDLFWDADPSHAKAKIAAGPNNPVGVVWIDLSKEHYGIHGTPEPSRVGHTESHGCIRLTNWDAMRVAGLVKTGTKVLLQ